MQNINRPEWTKLNYIGWLAFFKNNDKYRLTIDEFSLGTLSEYDKKLIAPSIAAFQCGEHSEGISLKKYAEKFSKLYDENIYNEVIDWFIKEENFHSHYLYVFMKGENIPFSKKNRLDKLFRKIRQCSGIESEIITLVTAEIIALTYYSVIGDATDSKELKKIWHQMLHDELPHIVFQSLQSHILNKVDYYVLNEEPLWKLRLLLYILHFINFSRKIYAHSLSLACK